MTNALDQSILELLNASRDDEETIYLPVNDRTFGLHTRQAIEKLLKALIAGHGLRYAFIHDLDTLASQATDLREILPIDLDQIGALTQYAALCRYQDPQPMSQQQRQVWQDMIRRLRNFVIGRLIQLRPDVDWNVVR